MTQQTIGVGSVANDGTGDPLRTLGIKTNDNFTELYSRTVASAYEIAAAAGTPIVGNGVADDRAAFQNFLTHVRDNGGDYYIPSGTYRLAAAGLSLVVTGTPLPFSIRTGNNVKFVRDATTVGTVLTITAASNFYIGRIEIDAKGDSIATGANHGISLTNCSNAIIEQPVVRNVLNSSIIIAATTGTSENIKVINAEIDGFGTTNNGMLFEKVTRGEYIGGVVEGCKGSPGYAFQFKNDCQLGTFANGIAIGCTAGLALGQDDANGADRCTYSNFKIVDCGIGAIIGYADNNSFDQLLIDMNSANNEAVRVQYASDNNDFSNVKVINLASNKRAILFEAETVSSVVYAPSNNGVRFTRVDGGGSKLVEFQAGSTNNTVVIEDSSKGDVTAESLVTDNSAAGSNNVFRYRNSTYTTPAV